MFIVKAIKSVKVPRWSILVPIITYIFFISIILNATFPLKRSTTPRNLIQISPDNYRSSELGNNARIFDDTSVPNTVIMGNSINEKSILKAAFKNANANRDANLSVQELARYINKKIREHIDNAIKTNPINFSQIDLSPRDGLISWEEYHSYFLRERGMDDKYISEHSESKHLNLDRKGKEEIMRDKALWAEAARTDPFSLTIDEFLAFRHPESSAVNLLSLVDDLLRQFDIDGDDHLTIDEFSDLNVDEGDEKYQKAIVSKTVLERREEFKRLIDKNKDGKADRGELLSYVDPRHPKYALQEAITLINLADANKDGMLSLEEILANSKIFMSSKMIDTSNSFHDEF